MQRNRNPFKVSQKIYETSKKVFYNLDKSFESVLCSYETFKKVPHSLQKKVPYGTIFFKCGNDGKNYLKYLALMPRLPTYYGIVQMQYWETKFPWSFRYMRSTTQLWKMKRTWTKPSTCSDEFSRVSNTDWDNISVQVPV